MYANNILNNHINTYKKRTKILPANFNLKKTTVAEIEKSILPKFQLDTQLRI